MGTEQSTPKRGILSGRGRTTAVIVALAVVMIAGASIWFLAYQRAQEVGRWNDAAATLTASLEAAYQTQAIAKLSLASA